MASASFQVYRPRRALGVAMGFGAALWLAALVYLASLGGVAPGTLTTAAAFLGFFAVAGVYYLRAAIFVDRAGLIVRSLARSRRVPFGDIRQLDVLPGPVTVYTVDARGRYFHFTSFFKHHRTLAALLVERAGLNRR